MSVLFSHGRFYASPSPLDNSLNFLVRPTLFP